MSLPQWALPHKGDRGHALTEMATPSGLTSTRSRKILRLAAIAGLILFFYIFYSFQGAVLDRSDGLSSPQRHSLSETTLQSSQNIDWSRFAYAQYVTDIVYLCNSVMFFERLQHLGSKAERIMLYPVELLPDPLATEAEEDGGRLLIRARGDFAVNLIPITVMQRPESDCKLLKHDPTEVSLTDCGTATWASSFTKLLVFNQTQYDRVLSMDSDSTVLQNMDELFLMPPAPVAMPRAYWLDTRPQTLTSGVLLVQPSHDEFRRIQARVETAGPREYDMDILNQLYGNTALIIPHRPYLVLSGEFRQTDHARYLGRADEGWDAVTAFNEAKYLHFSDYPVPKPWLSIKDSVMEKHQPSCEVHGKDAKDCSARDLWVGLYRDFKQRREVCSVSNIEDSVSEN